MTMASRQDLLTILHTVCRRHAYGQGNRGVQRLLRLCSQGHERQVDPAEARHRRAACQCCRLSCCLLLYMCVCALLLLERGLCMLL